MRIDGAGFYDETQRLELRRSSKKDRKASDNSVGAGEEQVIEENNRALAAAINDRDFEVNVEKVKEIKKQIDNGEYKPDSKEIAKRLILSEQQGDFKLGLFNTKPTGSG